LDEETEKYEEGAVFPFVVRLALDDNITAENVKNNAENFQKILLAILAATMEPCDNPAGRMRAGLELLLKAISLFTGEDLTVGEHELEAIRKTSAKDAGTQDGGEGMLPKTEDEIVALLEEIGFTGEHIVNAAKCMLQKNISKEDAQCYKHIFECYYDGFQTKATPKGAAPALGAFKKYIQETKPVAPAESLYILELLCGTLFHNYLIEQGYGAENYFTGKLRAAFKNGKCRKLGQDYKAKQRRGIR